VPKCPIKKMKKRSYVKIINGEDLKEKKCQNDHPSRWKREEVSK
jgi:hypothetical protein